MVGDEVGCGLGNSPPSQKHEKEVKAFAPNTEFWGPLGTNKTRAFPNATLEPLGGRYE